MEHNEKLSILYVEDEEITRDFISRLLKRRFKDIYVARNGEEGLKLYNQYRPTMVITDIIMPNMDGLEMIRRIKKTQEEVPPVIIATALKKNEYPCDLSNVHIMKPFDSDELIKAILTLSSSGGLK